MQKSKIREAGSKEQPLRTDSCPESSKLLPAGYEAAIARNLRDDILPTPAHPTDSIKLLCAAKPKQECVDGSDHQVTPDDEITCVTPERGTCHEEKRTMPSMQFACGASRSDVDGLISNGNGKGGGRQSKKKEYRSLSTEEKKGIPSCSGDRIQCSLWPPRSLQDCFSSTASRTEWTFFGKKDAFDESSAIKKGSLYAESDSVHQTGKAGWFFPAFAPPRPLPPLTVGDPPALNAADPASHREEFESESRTRYLFSWYPWAVDNKLLDRCKADVPTGCGKGEFFSTEKLQNRVLKNQTNSSVQKRELNPKSLAKHSTYKFSIHISSFASWLVQKIRSCLCIATSPGNFEEVTIERGRKVRIPATAVLKQISWSRVFRQWLALFSRPEKHPAAVFEEGSRLQNLDSDVAAESVIFTTPEGGYLLWCSSWSLILNPLAAFYFQCYRLGTMSSIVFVTSIVHWRKPEFGWRRNIDVLVVITASSVHIAAAILYSEFYFRFVYVSLFSAGILCYIVGVALASVGFHWEAAISHLGLHFLCTLGNVLLYNAVAS